MRQIKSMVMCSLILFLFLSSCIGQKKSAVSGTVVDQNGNPVNNATVALFWGHEYGNYKPREWQGVAKTNKQGEFKGDMTVSPAGATLFVMNQDKSLGAVHHVSFVKRKNLSITLVPLVTIVGHTELPGFPTEKMDKYWIHFRTSDDIGFNRIEGQDGKIRYKLPPGDYSFRLEARQAEHIEGDFTVPSNVDTFDMGTFMFEYNTIWRHVGKRPPEITATDARGINKDVSWDSLKGKWVAFEFWSFWCGPCTHRSLPELMKFYQEHPDLRDQFEIIAIHDESCKTFDELDKKLEENKTVEKAWGGQNLPFPVILDATGDMFKSYDIVRLPTLLLIDPEGHLVGESSVKELAHKLGVDVK
jgi:thiol-disulfide isomerase/thioredoxin